MHYRSPARESFLRALAKRADLPDHAEAFAKLALAEYLGKLYEFAEAGSLAAWPPPKDDMEKFRQNRIDREWLAYVSKVDAKAVRAESISRFHEVLEKYAEMPFKLTAPHFRDLTTIGQQAMKSLHALEHLYKGGPAPDFDAMDLYGHPVRLAEFRGKVVLLSFWFTGCGPCVAMVPKERASLKSFAISHSPLIGVLPRRQTKRGEPEDCFRSWHVLAVHQ